MEWHEDSAYAGFRAAFLRLRNLRGVDFRTAEASPLTATELERLSEHHGRLNWGYLGSEELFRYAILAGASKGALSAWADNVKNSPGPELDLVLAQIDRPDGERLSLAWDELSLINTHRDDLELSPHQLGCVFESQLLKGSPEDTDDVIYWAKRWRDHGA